MKSGQAQTPEGGRWPSYFLPVGRIAFAPAGRLDALVSAAAWRAQVFWIAVVVLVWRVLGRAPG